MAKDIIHDSVKNALQKDGWIITNDPYYIKYEEVTLAADLGAERVIAAEKGSEKIVVEIKSFVGISPIQDLKLAIGQYLIYRGFLEVTEPQRHLFLAVPDEIYEELFRQNAVQLIFKRYSVSVFSVDIINEVITRWIRLPAIDSS